MNPTLYNHLFTVIIPLYNKASYIEKAIRSVLNQTYKQFELIVVDDGSTDNSLEIVKNLHNSGFNFHIVSQSNHGVSVTKNNGVSYSNYNYITFLDADDWWNPDFLKEMKPLIEKYPSAGLFSCSYFLVKGGKNVSAKIGVEDTFEDGIINYFDVYSRTLYQPVWTGATIIKKSVFYEMNGFKPFLKLGEDFDLWVRVALKYPVAFLNKPLAYYNQDVDQENRAIGMKFYEPDEHMLFIDYSEYEENPDFVYLIERLALYGLLPYYLPGKNKLRVDKILEKINWGKHSFKYRLYYRILPKFLVAFYMNLMQIGSKIKKAIKLSFI